MFILHSSNKTENLLVHLTTVIENIPLTHPLKKEIFLIQSQGMERWLSQQLSSHFGVWGNYEFLFPGKFFSTIAKKVDKKLDDGIFDRELMVWRFEQQLRHLDDDRFLSLQSYLQGENKDLKRFQLAEQLAHIFDQYQMMRPDMLALWQKGKKLYQSENEIWQQALWQRITESTGHSHRGILWQNLIKKFNLASENEFFGIIPERIFVFGLNTMPPLFLDYLQGLSRHSDVHLFLLNPAQVYWADLVNKKLMDEAIEGHPLLSTLGQQGREFQQMLLEQAVFTYEPDSFEEIEVSNNLQQLQNDILHNQLQGQTLNKDNSISIHACHSRMREIEVLKDQLLLSLEQDPQLELREIVVMAPDIQPYAPFIASVFNDIQHTIADKTLLLGNSVLDTFIRFLKLSQSRFGWQGIMDLLEQPLVYPNFSLTESDLDFIKHWVADTNVRWGKSAGHKKELGLPELSQNTWQATLDRLFMGYAIGSEEHFVDNVLPYRDIEGTSALALGGLNDFLQLLFKASDELKHATSLKNWGQRLYYYADQLLLTQSQSELQERQQLNELFEDLSGEITELHTDDISLKVISAWLDGRVSERKSSTGFLRGQLTFCSMLPMRTIPFKVIALLGLNEGEFPKIDKIPTFDLVGKNFRKGDRSRRSDDRYQFLEILLSARQQLIVTYQGRSIHNNDDITPSVVISELLDVLEKYYQLTDLITKHPLQAFSRRYFDELPNLVNFSKTNFETAVALLKTKQQPEQWWQGTLETEIQNVIELNDLFSFYRHPQNYFLQRKLGLDFNTIEQDIDERELFSLNPLDFYDITRQWVEDSLNNKSFSLKKLQAQGRWLSGNYGKQVFEQHQQAIDEFSALIKQQAIGKRREDQFIDIHVGDYRLIGKLSNLYCNGGLIYRYTNLKGKDFMLAWLHHLVINQIQPQNTHLISLDDSLIFNEKSQQADSLNELIKYYIQGQKQPGAFFTESAFAYSKQASRLKTSKRATKTALLVAQEQLVKEMEYNRALHQLYKNIEDLAELLNKSFETQCKNLILPAWEAVQTK